MVQLIQNPLISPGDRSTITMREARQFNPVGDQL